MFKIRTILPQRGDLSSLVSSVSIYSTTVLPGLLIAGTGPTGPAGLSSNTGATGSPGEIGPTGPAGNTGTPGDIGPTGPQGLIGPTGDIGPTGPMGSTGNFNSVVSENISFTNGINITPFNIAGVVHNTSTGSLTSSLIVNADVSASAAIVDTKLATISTTGKVANTATSATGGNVINAIITRDSSGNFSANNATLVGLSTTGIVHNSAAGVLSTSLIVNNDITNTTITDAKLATITTSGKVANTATTATNANTASAIVARDASGNFIANNVTLVGLNTTGIVHNTSGGVLSTSLITNADITDGTITDAKLATISTAGKVLNSATTATSTNVNSAIVARNSGGGIEVGAILCNGGLRLFNGSFALIVNPAVAAATRQYNLPDAGRDCSFIMSTGTSQGIGGTLNLYGDLQLANITSASSLATDSSGKIIVGSGGGGSTVNYYLNTPLNALESSAIAYGASPTQGGASTISNASNTTINLPVGVFCYNVSLACDISPDVTSKRILTELTVTAGTTNHVYNINQYYEDPATYDISSISFSNCLKIDSGTILSISCITTKGTFNSILDTNSAISIFQIS
jgi:hypothetical protein